MIARVRYDMNHIDLPSEHPLTVMKLLASEKGFRILESTPQPIADQWQFRIEYAEQPSLPSLLEFMSGR
jgi:hypothetical protein